MKITGTSSYMNIEYKGRTVRFNGELAIDGFWAYKDSVHWLPPYNDVPVTEKEKNDIIAAVQKDNANKEVKIYFG